MAATMVILKLGETFPELAARRGDFDRWIVAGLGLGPGDAEPRVIDLPGGDRLPDDDPAGVILTGSHAMVTDRRPWSEQARRWLPGLVERGVSVLGICYGHQLLADALGGRVIDNPRGRSFGSEQTRLTDAAADDPLLGSLPTTFPAWLSHTQIVATLPPGARRLAEGPRDGNRAFAIGRRAWGVQFHPEFDAAITRHYIDRCADTLRAEGQAPDALAAACAEDSPTTDLLRRFHHLARQPK